MLRRFLMSDQYSFVSAGQLHPDPYAQSRTAERALNAAIVNADITRSYEEYLDILDAFYSDDVEGSSETAEEPIRGKTRLCSLLLSFLVPLHAIAEVGGVSISVRQTPIPGDVVDETHSAWTLELVGATGKMCTVSWRTFRKWTESRVVLKDIADGRATVVLAAGPQHKNPMGTLHGGILCDIADAAMGMAFASTLVPDESFTTVELKINFFRPVWQAHLKAEGNVVRRGSTIGYVECTIVDEENRLVAKAASTCMVLRDQKAVGR